jgi:epoxyqueuosine reductase
MFLSPNFEAQIKAAAQAEGFDLCGIASVTRQKMPELGFFEAWVAAGHAGEMRYLESRNEAGELKRSALQNAAPWAKSVVVCAINYNADAPRSMECKETKRGWISRYAWSNQDYHNVVLERLRRVEERIRTLSGDPQMNSRSYVDTGPVVERVYAKYAGIGWTGKNTCTINQQIGSWLFLGVILTSLDLAPDLPAPDRCGSCTRCLDACPTHAFIGPHQLDATKCIAYLTIEKRGTIAEELRSGMGNHVFGCDICQDVCPWNRKAPVSNAPEFQPRPELVNPALDWLAAMPREEWRRNFKGTPISRAKFAGLKRNAAVAMGNSGDRQFAPRLQELADDEDPIIAEHARWALERIKSI